MLKKLIFFVILSFSVTRCPSSSNVHTLDIGYELPDFSEQDSSSDTIQPDKNEPEVIEVIETTDQGVANETVEIKEPVVNFYFITSSGQIGLHADTVSLNKEDELIKYTDSIGFQVDIGAVLKNVETGNKAKLYIKDIQGAPIASEDVTVDPDTGSGTVVFSNVTLPHSLSGYPVKVEITNSGDKTGFSVKTVISPSGLTAF